MRGGKQGNPLLFRRAFNSGVKVRNRQLFGFVKNENQIIVAHCASLGSLPDLDKPDQPVVECFSLFLRLVREFPNLCYGDIRLKENGGFCVCLMFVPVQSH